jgi:hypothetical protein
MNYTRVHGGVRMAFTSMPTVGRGLEAACAKVLGDREPAPSPRGALGARQHGADGVARACATAPPTQ